MINHYRTLGVDPQAEAVVIRGAYLALIRRYHPDKGGAEADPVRAQAVTAAWEVLRDPGRRAAYDDARRARLEPVGGGGGELAAIIQGSRVRGGVAGRNLFLLLAAGTMALGWWALQQPFGVLSPPGSAVAERPGVPAAPTFTADSIEDRAAPVRSDPAEEQPRLPDVIKEPEVEAPVALPAMPEAKPAPVPVRLADVRQPVRRVSPAQDSQPARSTLPVEPRRAGPATSAATPTKEPRIDLAPLERHLQLLTDQSLRFGNEVKRSKLFATREGFLKQLRNCDNDACKRDAYLRRNAEVGEIMRN